MNRIERNQEYIFVKTTKLTQIQIYLNRTYSLFNINQLIIRLL